MRSFTDYLTEAAEAAEYPQVGDVFMIEVSPDNLIETTVAEVTTDGVVVYLDETAAMLMLDKGILLEDSNMPVAVDSTSPINGKKTKRNNPHDDLNHEITDDEEREVHEAEYQGRKVPLGKPMKGDVKKSKVYVKNAKGNVVKVNFGDKNMRIKKSNPKRRKNFRARHNCKNPGPRWKARYWSCRAW